jgi:hypothetical protein
MSSLPFGACFFELNHKHAARILVAAQQAPGFSEANQCRVRHFAESLAECLQFALAKFLVIGSEVVHAVRLASRIS